MNHTMKKLLAALVACMLLLSSVAALAKQDYSNGISAVDGQTIDYTGNVTGTSDGIRAENTSTVTVTGNVTGEAGVNAQSGSTVSVKGKVEGTVAKGVNSSESSNVIVTGDVTGVDAGVEAKDGKVTVTGDVTATGSYGDGVNASGEKTTVTVTGDVTAKGNNGKGVEAHDSATVTVNGSVESEKGYGVVANEDGKVTVTGNVTVTNTIYSGVNASSGAKVTVGTEAMKDDENVGNVKGGNQGVSATGKGTEVTVYGNVEAKTSYVVQATDKSTVHVTGDVKGPGQGVLTSGNSTVTIDGDVQSAGSIGIEATDSSVTVHGSVESAKDGTGVHDAGVNTAGTSTITVDGSVTGGNKGVKAAGDADVTVGGDVKAAADAGVGLRLTGKNTKEEAKEGEDGLNIIVAGTVSGKDAAVEVLKQNIPYNNEYDTDSVKVTVWALESEGDLVRVVNEVGYDRQNWQPINETDAEASEAFAKVINYIIKLAEKDNDLSLDTTEGQREVGKYKTAREGEEVTSKLAGYEEGDTLEVYYNENTKLDASQYKLENGSLIVKMLRGGAMNLLAKITKAVKPEETKTEEKAEETKTEETKPAEETKPVEETKPAEEVKPTEETKTETATETKAAETATRTEFVYVPVNDNTAVNGVKAADHADMGETFKTVGDSLDGEGASVDIVDKEKLMDAAELARFDKLSVKDRLLVVLKALGFGEALGEIAGDMSDAAVALSDDIAARVDAMTESERNALLNRLYGEFLPRLIVIDGQEYEAVGIEVVITRGGEKTYERYTFYKDGGAWKLYQIEQGEYRTVGA